jgi:uncharacterized protein YcbK (DUF882 family)
MKDVLSIGPSPHLRWTELACADGTPYPIDWRATRAVPLAREFERLRAQLDRGPIRILSAYRTAAYNARVPGAAKASQHVFGRALDLKPPRGCSVADLLAAVSAVAGRPDSAIRGIGEYAWGVHVDIRPGPRLVRWSGSKPIQVAQS